MTLWISIWISDPWRPLSSYISKIEILQKRAIRIVDNAERLAHTDPIFRKLKLLKAHQIAKQQMILLIQKTIFFNIRPAIKTRTIAWMGPRLWNTVICPKFQTIEDVPRSKEQMKKITKQHFLSETWDSQPCLCSYWVDSVLWSVVNVGIWVRTG